jgi:hypothetical protein
MNRPPKYKRSFRRRLLYLESWVYWVIAIVAIFLFVILAEAGCASLTSQQKAERALETSGFTHIYSPHREWFFIQYKGCGNEDAALYRFKATNPVGKPVTVTVCEGFFKGATIRGTE